MLKVSEMLIIYIENRLRQKGLNCKNELIFYLAINPFFGECLSISNDFEDWGMFTEFFMT